MTISLNDLGNTKQAYSRLSKSSAKSTSLFKTGFLAAGALLVIFALYHLSIGLPYTLSSNAVRASSGQDLSLATFLSQAGLFTRSLWVTIADGSYSRNAVPHLSLFLKGLHDHQDMLLLCTDDECMEECVLQGWLCYGGYRFTVDSRLEVTEPKATTAIWAKISSMRELAEAGYAAILMDGDVFLKSDPRPLMKPLSDASWDIQIQEETRDFNVNLGFLYQRAGPVAVQFWQSVLDYMVSSPTPTFDQAVVNQLLETSTRRQPPDGQPPLSDFISPSGLKVHVLDAKIAWGFHLGWLYPSETAILHTSCADSQYLKFYLAGFYGHWSDINSYYTKPPRLLSIPTLSGTQLELETTIQLLLSLAKNSGRSLLLPAQATLFSESVKDDGRSADLRPELGSLVAHRRNIYSIYRLEQLERESGVKILEPNYIAHATPFMVQEKKYDELVDLARYQEMDLRFQWNYVLASEALQMDLYMDKLHVRLTTDEGMDGHWSHFGDWDTPKLYNQTALCSSIERAPTCGALCRLQ